MKESIDPLLNQEPRLVVEHEEAAEETAPVPNPTPESGRDVNAFNSRVPPAQRFRAALPVLTISLAVASWLCLSWWLGPNGCFYEFNPQEYPSMSSSDRFFAGVGVELRILRARLAHKRSWLCNSFAAAGDYKLCCGDENGAIAAYRESIRYGPNEFDDKPAQILVALYQKQGRWEEAHKLLKEIYNFDSQNLVLTGSYAQKQFLLIAMDICRHVNDEEGFKYFQRAARDTANPWHFSQASSRIAFDACSEVMDKGCRLLLSGDYSQARACFEWMQEPEMDQRTQARGALMTFITSVKAGNRQQSELDFPKAWSSYNYFNAAGNAHREVSSFLHQYAIFLRWHGQNDAAKRCTQDEAVARHTKDPELQGFTNGTIGPSENDGPG